MSLRNELRGPQQSMSSWYKSVKRGARKIHQANPNVLIIVSGLNYGTDLSFLQDRPLGLSLDKKLVYEAHWYSFSLGKRRDWEQKHPGRMCAGAIRRFESKVGFLADDKPLFVSEFGVDQRGINRADNRFLPCFLAYAAEKDLDWAMWALQGSYYRRKGQAGFEETYGVLDAGWDGPRNSEFNHRFRLLHELLQDGVNGSNDASSSSHLILFHPLSGHCVQAKEGSGRVVLGDCESRSRWSYQGDGTPIKLMGSELCLRMTETGSRRVRLSSECSDGLSLWRALPGGELRLAVSESEGMLCCMARANPNSTRLVGGECVCLDQDEPCDQNPQVQWFKLVPSNVASRLGR